MAIRMMVGPEKAGLPGVETVTTYPGHEAAIINHVPDCPNRATRTTEILPGCITEGWACKPYGPLFMETTHVGLVLSTGEYNGYDDSDFFAEVWNAAEGRPERIIYASTRGWTYPNGAAVDATPEVTAAYKAYLEARHEAARKAREEAERREVKVGKDVRVVRGRKVPKGTVGRVTWMGLGKWGMRVAIMEANATRHFTALDNVEVVEEAA